MEPDENEKGERYAKVYEINELRCIFCGYCQEVCPVDAVFLGKDYELTVTDPGKLRVSKDQMLVKGEDPRYSHL